MKKKVCLFLGVLLLLSGLRLFDNGLLNISRSGVFTVYNANGSEKAVYQAGEAPVFDRFFGYTRLDVMGGEEELESDLKNLFASIQFSEKVDDIVIVYAYSPFIMKYETVHGKKVNVMAALKGGVISYGCPLLLGSY